MYTCIVGTSEILEIKSTEQCTIYSYDIYIYTQGFVRVVRRRLPRTWARVPIGVKPPSRCIRVARSNATDSSQFRTSCAGPIVSQLPVNKLPRQFRKLQVQRMKSHNLKRSCALPLFRSDAHTIRLPGWSSFVLTHVLRRICHSGRSRSRSQACELIPDDTTKRCG